MSDASLASTVKRKDRVSQSDIDSLLSAQLIVAWAGEKGDPEEPASQRLGWWQTNLVGEGAEYEFKDLLPNTWRWGMLQAVRHAAKIHDASVRAKDHDPIACLRCTRLVSRSMKRSTNGLFSSSKIRRRSKKCFRCGVYD